MIQNFEAREEIVRRIMAAPNGKRRGYGTAFRTDANRAAWLAPGERAVGIVGGKRNMAIYSPAKSRDDSSPDRILFYGHEAVLVHEEIADETAVQWFNTAFTRAA